MMDITLTPFKRRYVENWRKDVQKHLEEGSICRIVVAQINSDDEEGSEQPVNPTTPLPPPPSGNRAKQISREKSSSEKLADMAVSSSLHIQAFPSVRFMYTNAVEQQKKNSEKLFGGIPVSGRQVSRKDVAEAVNVSEDKNESKPLVIVDPQLMTPLEHPELSTQENKKPSKDVRFPMKITSLQSQGESKKYGRLPLFAKCKIQSTERNSFVVSRSNLLKNGKAKNHSFLTLPVRFQVQAQTNDRLIQSSDKYILKEKTNLSQTPRKDFRRSPRKVDFPLATPRVSSNTVWAW